jgi:hypothetical protein
VLNDSDSIAARTFTDDRNKEFLFVIAYDPDSLNENQLLYEMARYNFSNFMVRNFDINIEQATGIRRMTVSGFLNFDEALQYARLLYADDHMQEVVRPCRSIVISPHNLSLIGTRYSYRDYDEFYERTFLPLQISNEELLQIPEAVEQVEEKSDDDNSGSEETQKNNQPTSNDDFDPDDLF